MVATPCAGEGRKGASHMDGARGPLNMDVNWPGTPFVVRQADGVASCEVWRRIFMHPNPRIITFRRGIIHN
jgi:hypothetical protein